ncbi:MAG: hypothetical protein SPI06_02110 [Terrisporobacter sp.]|uniref:hypothetical protein n=1 Tax=Terrisporobacter sp. TaxID=1965305 RepID=UPI002A9153E9|nr:hypothetical protein [Terrisporobacter sp.]MDY6152183.1 hypothetical protein [Terrisporobacter sp.]
MKNNKYLTLSEAINTCKKVFEIDKYSLYHKIILIMDYWIGINTFELIENIEIASFVSKIISLLLINAFFLLLWLGLEIIEFKYIVLNNSDGIMFIILMLFNINDYLNITTEFAKKLLKHKKIALKK